MKNLGLINDKRLTPTMDRSRDGGTQLFREKKPGERSFINFENCDLTLKHERPSVYADFIDGEWYWVEGCNTCNGLEKSPWNDECDEHNVCINCSIKRYDVKEPTVYGRRNGWVCKSCHNKECDEERAAAFEKYNEAGFDENDFHFMDEIKCPHCGTGHSSDDINESQDKYCDVCTGEFEIEVEYTVSYSMSIKGERVTE